MKKLAIVTSAALLMFTAALNAQTDTKQPVATTTTEKPVVADKYNNWSADTYKLQPMPEALTNEKIFPVIGKYQLTDKAGTASAVTVSLDPENKGLIWVEGLPQGKIKATLRKSPATYKIPAQKVGEEKDAKDVAEGVLIYDKDANVLNVCIGCTYKSEDPATVFMTTEPVTTEVEKVEKKATKSAKKSTAKVVKIKTLHYSGNKVIETTAAVNAQ
jgi:hypothetical protein